MGQRGYGAESGDSASRYRCRCLVENGLSALEAKRSFISSNDGADNETHIYVFDSRGFDPVPDRHRHGTVSDIDGPIDFPTRGLWQLPFEQQRRAENLSNAEQQRCAGVPDAQRVG